MEVLTAQSVSVFGAIEKTVVSSNTAAHHRRRSDVELLSRAVVVIAADGMVASTESVPEIGKVPNDDAAMESV
ncbi:hypothetical protein ACWDTI_25120 [Gordonia sp. NPDC003424]